MLKEKEFSRGGCTIAKINPVREKISSETKTLNVYISFEEALKLTK